MLTGLSSIVIKNLRASGVHGSTGREPHDPQQFLLNVAIEVDAAAAAQSDSIKDTFDYKIARAIALHVIKREGHVLLERIADRIASRICQYRHVQSVRVEIEKPDSQPDCVPAFVGTAKRMPQALGRLLPLDSERVIDEISKKGGASFPILPNEYRQALLDEAELYSYEKQEAEPGVAGVSQDLSLAANVFPSGLFAQLRDDFDSVLAGWHGIAREGTPVFSRKCFLNDIAIQLYEKGSRGITRHRDFARSINLVCIFVLAGEAKFGLYEEGFSGSPYCLDASPGNVIILRANGFLGKDIRPYHHLSEVTERRIVCGLRQVI